jgi:hypothetical protein
MSPEAVQEYLVSVLEDWAAGPCDGSGEQYVPASRFAGVAESITESWFKNQRRAVAAAVAEVKGQEGMFR